MKFQYSVILVMLLSGSCIQTTTSDGVSSIEETAFLSTTSESDQNEKLVQQTLTSREKKRRERNLDIARNNYENDPNDQENSIWYGRRLAYLGKFREAINVFSKGITQYPDSYKLLRHRGHRYITIRDFDKAIEDLLQAAFYANAQPNEIEPDGIPNAYNKPLSTIKFNIWYHLGLAYYFNGNYDKAISSLRKCMEYSSNNDLKVATSNWLYNTYRRIGNVEAANEVIKDISPRMTLIENRVYHDLIMLYRGFVTPEILIERNTSGQILSATVGYGIASYLQSEGKAQQALELYNRILSTDQWDSFGYIGAEVAVDLLSQAPPM